ncbi:hypothetical protein FIU83_06005 [Halomonas sp. THAF5a]|uniref:hypothetical protein n=1 Tax=Halomonas sp. THAF5a TaxID=2587844 RepID=UPI0012A92CBA|nr:hypothetical protein [Halomonas sp. THAF5a]QFU01187.1 hypothetical protein FIU83_06005 [Halomonas sp. THAF5a]
MLRVEEWLTTQARCLEPRGHPLSGREEVSIDDLKDQFLVIGNQPNVGADLLREYPAWWRPARPGAPFSLPTDEDARPRC